MIRQLELKRVGVIRVANLSALMCAILYGIIALCMIPFFLILGMIAASSGGSGGEIFGAIFMIILYPILGAIFGWLWGALSTAVYNLVVRWIGGIQMTFEEVVE